MVNGGNISLRLRNLAGRLGACDMAAAMAEAPTTRPAQDEPGTPGPDTDAEPRAILGQGPLFAIIMAVVVVQGIVACASNMRFSNFAYNDMGATLALELLQDQGLQPGVDFGQLYGLVTLVVGRAWFWAFGKTPAAFLGLMAVCNLLMGWGLARLVFALRLGLADLVLLLVSLGFLAPAGYPGPVYALESVLLCHALAEQARGRRGRALALATACCFTKPTMAYFYGLLLLIAIVVAARRRGPAAVQAAAIWRPVACAAATGAALLVFLLLVYGTAPLVNSILWPFVWGSRHYRLEHFGFFHGYGRFFWWPPGARPGYYAGTVAGTWIAATFVLMAGVAAEAWSLVRRKPSRLPGHNAEVQACCAVMHLAFVTLFYAHAWSWWYYYYILISGVIAGSRRGRAFTLATWFLAATALLPTWNSVQEYLRAWQTAAPYADAGWVWFTPAERRTWARVLEITQGQQPVMLSYTGCASALSPEFAPPTTLWLYRGIALPVEVERKRAQIASASMVVVAPPTPPSLPVLRYWPEIAAELKGWECLFDEGGFQVYARPGPRSSPGGQTAAATPRPGSS